MPATSASNVHSPYSQGRATCEEKEPVSSPAGALSLFLASLIVALLNVAVYGLLLMLLGGS